MGLKGHRNNLGKISLGIHVHKSYLHWALRSVNSTYIGLFGSLGFYKDRYRGK